MQYEIYIDKLWLSDFVINTYLLLLVRQTFRLRSRWYKLFLSAAVNAAVFVFLLLVPGIWLWVKFLLQAVFMNLLMLQAAFSFRTKEMVVKSYACMNGYGLLFGGMLYFISTYLSWGFDEMNLFKVVFSGALAALAVGGYLHYKKRKGKDAGIYRVTLDFYGIPLSCLGFADSGNSLYEPYRKRPVAVLYKKAAEELLEQVPAEKHYLIPYHSIGRQHGLLSAVELPMMKVDSGEHQETFYKVVIALSEEKLSEKHGYQLILHPDFVKQEE